MKLETLPKKHKCGWLSHQDIMEVGENSLARNWKACKSAILQNFLFFI